MKHGAVPFWDTALVEIITKYLLRFHEFIFEIFAQYLLNEYNECVLLYLRS
jgi:hypothetical protein